MINMDLAQIHERASRAWNVEDPTERRRLVEATCSPELEVSSPYGETRGIEAHLQEIAQVRAKFPNLRCTGRVLVTHHGWTMDAWITEFGEGSPPLHGVDVTHFDDAGRITKIISFSPVVL
jgi:hypothetical protein